MLTEPSALRTVILMILVLKNSDSYQGGNILIRDWVKGMVKTVQLVNLIGGNF